MPIQTKATTPSSSTPKLEIYTASRNKNENNGPTSTFDDLLNSFQKEPTTTRRPQLTTFSDADDIAFLTGLVRFKVLLLQLFAWNWIGASWTGPNPSSHATCADVLFFSIFSVKLRLTQVQQKRLAIPILPSKLFTWRSIKAMTIRRHLKQTLTGRRLMKLKNTNEMKQRSMQICNCCHRCWAGPFRKRIFHN